MTKRALLILYYYPPIGGIGTIRTLRLARHLPSLGWEPLVLTVSTRTLAVIPCDEGEGELEGVTVFRTPNPDIAFRIKRMAGLEISKSVEAVQAQEEHSGQGKARLAGRASNWLGIPDRFIDWFPFARRSALDICRVFSPEVIFSSSPPETCHLIAASVKRATGIPWLADLRDPWTEKFNMPRPPASARLNAWLEARTLPLADLITAVTPPVEADLEEDLGLEATTITNSYDEEAFASAQPIVEERLNLLYAGTLYYPAQDPRPLFRALRAMRESGRDISRVLVQFAGKDTSVATRLATEEGVEDVVEVLGMLPFSEAVAREKGAAALLYIQIQSEGAGQLVSEGPTGKMLEYIGAGRPVLSLMPVPGPVDDFISDRGLGQVARDEGGIRRVLEGWLNEYEKTGSLSHTPGTGLERFGSRAMARRFADLFDKIT